MALRLVLPAGARPAGAGPVAQPAQRVLFVGNSLTAANDLPALVEALGRAAGGPAVEAVGLTFNNFSLEDHWGRGDARQAIERGGWTWVVLQQGPSALPDSQVSLRDWTRRFDAEIRKAGGRTALYMVWPSRARAFDFAGVSASYAAAAREIAGRLLPVGDAWRQAWALDRSLTLYGPDAFHPSELGSYLAALVIYQGLTGRSPAGLPAQLVVRPGRALVLDDRTAGLLQQAAAAVAATRSR
ncbi:MAG TPA: hypothetical protein VMM93_11445 [Vicinamibacterales bacterium]|nr:hypothetical protein [Vicinamibacterales bacterium]